MTRIIGIVLNKMPNLIIRGIPKDLYNRLDQLANVGNRSLSAQIIDMLSKAVDSEERLIAQTNILKSIQNRRFKSHSNTPSTLDSLREDRGR